MLKLLVCVSILIALSGAAYDFTDSDFNELLIDDMTADDDYLGPLRLKRSADNETEPKECHRKKAKKERDSHCCSGERANPQELEAIKEVKKNCIAEVRSGDGANEVSYDPLNCDSVHSMRQQMVCAAECMAKRFDLIEANGDLKRDGLLNQTMKAVGESKWKAATIEEFVDQCLGGLKPSKELARSDGSENAAKCNPNPLEFHHCIWKKFVEGCPAEAQIDSKKCRKIRERLARGDTSYADKSFKRRLRPHH